jgi:16S rRNA (cytosine1402-N4)-methyltransferase
MARFPRKPTGQRSTPAGEHRPVLLDEILTALDPQPGSVVVDCTVGWGGHAAELLRRVGPAGQLIGIDFDAENLARARARLEEVGHPFTLHQGNFAGLPAVLANAGIAAVDGVLADLGMSSMQVDDPERGFSYRRAGPLDMRMDRSRGRTAAQLLASIPEAELWQALQELGDEPEAERIAAAVIAARGRRPLERTGDLVEIIMAATRGDRRGAGWRLHPSPGRWELHPAARTFQVLRILVNRELANLEQLLRVLPEHLRPGGKAAILSFHSGEDRLVKAAFRDGQRAGLYAWVSPEPIRASPQERAENPRSRSAKLRLARRGERPDWAAGVVGQGMGDVGGEGVLDAAQRLRDTRKPYLLGQ